MFGRGTGTKDAGTEASGTSGATGQGAQVVHRIRIVLAQVVWALFLVAALLLAVGALLIALDADQDNALVKFVLDGAERVDLGIFSKDNGVKQFSGEDAETKNALFNWGIAAAVWLIVGRMVERAIRP